MTMMIYRWPGFLFSPSDEQLVDHYLIKNRTKIDPWGIIREFDVYSKDPWDLPGDFLLGPNKNEELFFSPRRCESARGNGSRVDRTAGSGYWHSNSSSEIHCSSGLVAYKTSLNFKIKDARNAGKWVGTDWIMQEYLLSPGNGNGKGSGFGFQEKALCKVYNKKKKKGMKQGSWCLPPPSKRARIEVEVEDEVVHHQEETEEEVQVVGWASAAAVHQQEGEDDVVHHQEETEEEEGDVALTSAAVVHQEEDVVHHQETEEEGDVALECAAVVHQDEISQPTSHLDSSSTSTSTAQEAAAQGGLDQHLMVDQNSNKEMEALAQAQVQISEEEALDDVLIPPLDCPWPDPDLSYADQFLVFQNSPKEMEMEMEMEVQGQVQVSDEASATSYVFPPLASPLPNSDITQHLKAHPMEMEVQGQLQISDEASATSYVFPPVNSPLPNSDFTQYLRAHPMEMEAQAYVDVEAEVEFEFSKEKNSDVFSPLDKTYCALSKSDFAFADQPLWEWDSPSFFGRDGDNGMGMCNATTSFGFAHQASQLLPPHSHSSNSVNAA